MNYTGVIIEESLGDKSVLQKLTITNTKIEQVIDKHKTPWLTQWTLYTVEGTEEKADEIVKKISESFDPNHPDWYADYKNDKFHYIIFSGKIFKVDLSNPVLYEDAKQYGISIGIPEYQVDFVPQFLVHAKSQGYATGGEAV